MVSTDHHLTQFLEYLGNCECHGPALVVPESKRHRHWCNYVCAPRPQVWPSQYYFYMLHVCQHISLITMASLSNMPKIDAITYVMQQKKLVSCLSYINSIKSISNSFLSPEFLQKNWTGNTWSPHPSKLYLPILYRYCSLWFLKHRSK